MSKRRPANTYKSVAYKITHGYGRGEGLSYKPFFTGHEFASMGMFIRLTGVTVPRLYRFFSRLEADAFVIYDCMPDVTDILEQYYNTLEETLEIADLLHVRHPFSGKYYNPVTTDLLVCKGGSWIARSIKSSRELEDKRTIEKLEIERAYFSRRNIDWKLITEKEINRDLVQNLHWLWYEAPSAISFDKHLLPEAESYFCQLYKENLVPFPRLLEQIESTFFPIKGAGVALFKSLVRQGKICVDLEKPLNMLDPRHPLERGQHTDERYRAYC